VVGNSRERAHDMVCPSGRRRLLHPAVVVVEARFDD